MALILTAAQMRAADAATIAAGTSGETLMERAGRAVAQAASDCSPDAGRIVIVAGPGNNGGDGYAAARFLVARKADVTVVGLVPLDSLRGDAARQAQLAGEAGVKMRRAAGPEEANCLDRWLKRARLVVDAIFGTGLARPVEGWFGEAVARINASDRPVLAVDIASGIDSDNGRILGAAVRADFTLPIAATKWGHWLHEGWDHAGRMLPVAGIGIDVEAGLKEADPRGVRRAEVLSEARIATGLPPRERNTHKGDCGHVWVFGGSRGYTGAPRLAASAALAAGAGLASIACPRDVYPIVAASSLEVMVHAQDEAPWRGAQAVVAGPGWGREQQTMLGALAETDVPLVVDADALNMLAADEVLRRRIERRDAVTVFTPHPGEAGRLLDCNAAAVQEDRPRAAIALVRRLGGWVVLKGAGTLVVSPQRDLWFCPYGSPRLATAGTGDVLSGMIAALLAQGLAPEIAVPAAVGLHARAGEQSGWYRAGQLPQRVAAMREEFGQA